MSYHLRHGTHDGYGNHGCRCRDCREAFASAYYMRQEQRAARTPCAIEGCDGGLYARGLCRAHYERQRTGLPVDVLIHRRPSARGLRPGRRKASREGSA